MMAVKGEEEKNGSKKAGRAVRLRRQVLYPKEVKGAMRLRLRHREYECSCVIFNVPTFVKVKLTLFLSFL